jgi:hypothetical protein
MSKSFCFFFQKEALPCSLRTNTLAAMRAILLTDPGIKVPPL